MSAGERADHLVAKWVAKWVVEKVVVLAGLMGVLWVAWSVVKQVVDWVDETVATTGIQMADKKVGSKVEQTAHMWADKMAAYWVERTDCQWVEHWAAGWAALLAACWAAGSVVTSVGTMVGSKGDGWDEMMVVKWEFRLDGMRVVSLAGSWVENMAVMMAGPLAAVKYLEKTALM